MDALALIPLTYIKGKVEFNSPFKWFYIMKQLRLVKETKNLDTKKLLEQLKEHSKFQLQTYIDKHPEFREDSE